MTSEANSVRVTFGFLFHFVLAVNGEATEVRNGLPKLRRGVAQANETSLH